MFVGKIRVKRLLPLIFLCFILLPNFTPIFKIIPVLADEAEEEDGFRQMPNWRWRNVSTTSGNVQEDLIEDVYRITSINNPSGTSIFRKGRTLNSRDFYYESRFAMDIGGSTVEIFQDELGDPIDWEENDYEYLQTYSGATYDYSSIAGMANISQSVPDLTWGLDKFNMVGLNLYTSSYRYLEFRLKAYGASQYDFRIEWGLGPSFRSMMIIQGDLPTSFTNYRIDLWEYPEWLEASEINRHYYVTSTDSSGSYLIDYIRYIGVMDYASFYQGEIEDAWDFKYGDSLEYWDDVYGNISDFNDGSLEVWNPSNHTDIPNLVAYYEFDEGTGSTLYDYTSNNHDGTNVGSIPYDTSFNSQANYSLDFTPNDYVTVPDHNDFSFDSGSPDSPFTIDAWINTDTTSGTRIIAGKYNSLGGNMEYYLSLEAGGVIAFRLWEAAGLGDHIYATSSSGAITTGTWFHVLGTYDGSGIEQGITVYINGVNNTNARGEINTYAGMTAGSEPFTIGKIQSLNYFDGKIDNVRLWNKTFVQSQITELYNLAPYIPNQNFPPELTNLDNNWLDVSQQTTDYDESILVSRYSMNTGSGDIIYDSISGHDGTQATGNWINSPIDQFGIKTADFPSPDSIDLGDDDDFTFLDAFSIDCWFNKTSDIDGGSLIMKMGVGVAEREYNLLVNSAEWLAFRLYDIDGDWIGRRTPSSAITVNKWSHITVTYDNSTSSSGIKIYVNGTQVDSTDDNSGTFDGMHNTNEKVWIGGELMGGSGFVFGEFDEVRFYSIELTPESVLENYNNAPDIISPIHTVKIVSDPFNPAINRDTYEYLHLELTNVRGKIKEINVYNKTESLVFTYPYNISQGVTKDLYLLGTSLWSGTSGIDEYLSFEITYWREATNYLAQYYLNYTYLQDVGSSFDDWGNVDGIYIEDNTVNFIANSTKDFELLTLRNIPSEYFENFRINIRGNFNGKYQLKAYDGSSWVNMTDMISFTTEWQLLESSLRLVANWKDVSNQRKLGLQFYNSSGLPITEDSLIIINYMQLLGHYDEDEGFKFALYNEDDNEGMYWKFTRIGSGLNETYLITVDMLDHTGVALHFNETFQYDRFIDGWLRLDVEWHLDKKKVKMELEFENGTNIIKTRSISYLYPVIPTELRLYLLQEGYPSLIMDNSMSGFSKSIVWIDYIDADWTLNEWREESAGTVWTEDDGAVYAWYSAGYPYQNSTSAFSSISPYGMTQYHLDGENLGYYYWLDVDRFDGVKYDLRIKTDNLDQNDYVRFYCDMYEVQHDGSTSRIANSEWLLQHNGASWSHIHYNNRYDGARLNAIVDPSTAKTSAEISYSFFRESENILTLQTTFDNGDIQDQTVSTFRQSGRWTQEFIVFFYYYVENSNSGYADDEISIEIRGFDVTRKDILGSIVAAVLSPILFVIGIIMTPVILFLQAVMLLLSRLFGILLAGLQPLLTLIVSSLVALFGPVTEFIGSILEFLLEFGNLIFEILFSLLEEWMIFITELYGAIIDQLIFPLIDLIIDGLGLRPILEFIIGFIGDMVLVLFDLLSLLGTWVGTVFAIIGYWINVNRLGALVMWGGALILFYLFSPILRLWQLNFEDLTFEDMETAFSDMFERTLGIFGWVWQITTYIFDFVFNVLKTIGNYIPFT